MANDGDNMVLLNNIRCITSEVLRNNKDNEALLKNCRHLPWVILSTMIKSKRALSKIISDDGGDELKKIKRVIWVLLSTMIKFMRHLSALINDDRKLRCLSRILLSTMISKSGQDNKPLLEKSMRILSTIIRKDNGALLENSMRFLSTMIKSDKYNGPLLTMINREP